MYDGVDTDVRCFYVGSNWPMFADRCRPYLDKMAAGSGGRYETADIVNAITAGQFHLWLMIEGPDILAALLTEVVNYPRSRAMRGIGIVGHRSRRWVATGHAAVELASRIYFGCDRMEALVQEGHERMLIPFGYQPRHMLLDKPL
jgi:hypothetical protein